ncbi:MAG: sensor domain-containing diguanylate cyclase [gamma proteobacterium symbiont of Bathyaustriella thionipta]|nr:sensor domain-containing diguanylate cyclase [gamma proteobacterium symbiont of Bathyaustriella thionipta]MCU7950083.1 sensor domain-containing diguanylate cyclase [gamma proteobacterium symbiont of Bathyaustriella thionipta]MCU7953933.1 sensor domain-containing diguanylate cyclase [gamma proteobacterium symbiont of Bathyaustriella thionipta]MCU7956668.1 sensor domain-containing diguanylate cyclase [gamma proteobacterium symbiont of Bathyaustriella thionipta]MCU7967876.1 sensor domain-contai
MNREDINNDISDWESRIHPDDRESIVSIVEKSIKTDKPYVGDFRMQHKDGHWVWIQGSGSLIESQKLTDEPLRLCGIHQDISYRKQMEKELEFRAKHDCLTGLYNRVELEKECQEEITRARRYQHSFSIFMIDIDHFKPINDTYGHLSGDQVLKQFADFLKETVRTTDYVARYGGEEFVVILPETSLIKAEELAERLRVQTTELDVSLQQTTLKITICIGISSYPEHGKSYDKLLEAADAAMYQSKNNGRNCVRLASCHNDA